MSERVLVVDDDEDIRTVLRVTLELAGFTVITAADGPDGLDLARSESPDVILLDVMMPSMDGLEVLTRLRADARTAHLPVLLVTARVQSQDAVDGLEKGADDYITKPFDPDEVAARVRAAIRRADQIRARNPLTGLPGNERILTELTGRLEAGTPTALLYVDLNDFKPYNDHYGFLRGDNALRALGSLLAAIRAELDDEDAFVGHVGGDDFVVVVRPDLAEAVAQRICAGFDVLAPSLYDADDREAGSIEVADRRGVAQRFGLLSLSIGIATTDRGEFEHHGEIVEVATEMKRYAKTRRSGSSVYALDRREDGRDVEVEIDLPSRSAEGNSR
jgi:diguanylate cyclase (GGDEF)-like protein